MYQISVSGAAKGKSVEQSKDIAYQTGKAIAEKGHTLLSGATSGLPDYAAHGAKAAGGKSIGISPAASRVEHLYKYRLPTACYDTILFTGLHYVGRDTLLISSSDAVISIGGRLGTLHEFTIAMEMDKPIGFVENTGGTGELIKEILKAAGKKNAKNVFFDEDPKKLIDKIEHYLKEHYGDNHEAFLALEKNCSLCQENKN